MEIRQPKRQSKLSICPKEFSTFPSVGEGIVTESFLVTHGYLNCDIVPVMVNFHKAPFHGPCRNFANPISPDVKCQRAKVLKSAFLQLKAMNSLEMLEYSCDRKSSKMLDIDNDTIYVSQNTAFNLCKQNPVQHLDFIKAGECSLVTAEPISQSVIVDLAIVTPVHLSYSVPEKCYDEALLEFFLVPRLLNSGDMFLVTLEESKLRQLGLTRYEMMLWFVVTSLQKNGKEFDIGYISRPNTTLKSQGICNAYVMPDQCSPLVNFVSSSLSPAVENISESSSVGLIKASEILQKLFQAFLFGASFSDVTTIIFGQKGVGKSMLVENLCLSFGMHLLDINCYQISGDSVAATEKRILNVINQASKASPAVLYLRSVDVLCKSKDGDDTEFRLCKYLSDMIEAIDAPVFVIGSSACNLATIHTSLLRIFMYVIHVEAPDEDERKTLLELLLKDVQTCRCFSVTRLAKKCGGMLLGDLKALVSLAIQNSMVTQEQKTSCVTDSCSGRADPDLHPKMFQGEQFRNELSMLMDNGNLNVDCNDFDKAFEKLIEERADQLDMPQVPEVKWDDVGGLLDAKKEIMDTIQVPLRYPGLVSKGLQRSGILFYGPPGCGKTLLAKAVATELNLHFMSVKGPEVLNMYVGQSEENIRNIFSKARSAAPCIIFFDELDSLAPQRGRSGDSGGVMDRVVSQLLAELDGVHSGTDIFVIGATNRPDLLDPALIRPGRFDKVIHVGLSDSKEDRLRILKAITRKMSLGLDVKLEDVESFCPSGLTGADFSAICSDATLNAYRRVIRELETGNVIDSDKEYVSQPPVCFEDFKAAIRNLTLSPSTS